MIAKIDIREMIITEVYQLIAITTKVKTHVQPVHL